MESAHYWFGRVETLINLANDDIVKNKVQTAGCFLVHVDNHWLVVASVTSVHGKYPLVDSVCVFQVFNKDKFICLFISDRD